MLLADVLAVASRKVKKRLFHPLIYTPTPKVVIDYATLTGTCITSLTNRYIGVFTNRKELVSNIISSGELSGMMESIDSL